MPNNTDVITKSKIAKHTNIGEGQEMGELRWVDMVQGTLHKRIWMDGWMDRILRGTRIRVCERENVRQIRSDHTRHCVYVCVCVCDTRTNTRRDDDEVCAYERIAQRVRALESGNLTRTVEVRQISRDALGADNVVQ